MTIQETFGICVDCMYYIEYGTPEHKAAWDAGMRRLNKPDVYNENTDESYFSWEPCAICASKTGGERFDVLAVWYHEF